jgi:hypothetical protein
MQHLHFLCALKRLTPVIMNTLLIDLYFQMDTTPGTSDERSGINQESGDSACPEIVVKSEIETDDVSGFIDDGPGVVNAFVKSECEDYPVQGSCDAEVSSQSGAFSEFLSDHTVVDAGGTSVGDLCQEVTLPECLEVLVKPETIVHKIGRAVDGWKGGSEDGEVPGVLEVLDKLEELAETMEG